MQSELIIGMTGVIAGAFFSNLDKVFEVIETRWPFGGEKPWKGNWFGIAQEYSEDAGRYVTGNERVNFSRFRSKKEDVLLVGEIKSQAANDPRWWRLEGKFHTKGSILVLNYELIEPKDRISFGTYVLKGNPSAGFFKGYWLGYDREKQKLIAAPYVLTRNQELTAVERENKAWLNRSGYEM